MEAIYDLPDLASEIVGFLDSLPATISPEILMFVMLYALDDDTAIDDAATFLPEIKQKLSGTSGMKRMSIIIRIIGALDYVLQRAVDKLVDIPNVVAVLSEKRPDLADRISARQPLTLKHQQAALSSWKKLRTNLLTYANLSRYEDDLLMPRYLIG
jgi:hypothetical protein